MKNVILLVASEEEKKSLIPSEYYNNVFITGIGLINVIKTLKNLNIDENNVIINIGYAGSSNDINIGSICSITESLCYRNIYNKKDNIKMNYIKNKKIINLPCSTSIDFVINAKEKNMVYDMELRGILEFFPNTYSIKIISDNGNMNDYDNFLKNNYKKEIKEIIDENFNV